MQKVEQALHPPTTKLLINVFFPEVLCVNEFWCQVCRIEAPRAWETDPQAQMGARDW